MARVRGNTLLGVIRWVERTHGEDQLQALLRDLPEGDRAILAGILLPGSWYPVGLWNRLLDGFVSTLGRGNRQSFRPAAEFIAANDMTTVFKVLLKLATPTTFMGRIPSLWERYFDVCSAVAHEEEPTRYVIKLSGPLGLNEAPNALTCGVGVPAWVVRALALTGAKESSANERVCRFRGARACEVDVSWRNG